MPEYEHFHGPKPFDKDWKLNVVLFNGLKGNARDTWTPPDGKPWWADFSEMLGGATILSYSVPQHAFVKRGQPELRLEENAREIVDHIANEGLLKVNTVFVGYSFGGIVLKRIVADIRSDRRFLFRAEFERLDVSGGASSGFSVGTLFAEIPWTVWFGPLEDSKPGSPALTGVGRVFDDARERRFSDVRIISVRETERISLGSYVANKVRPNRLMLRLPDPLARRMAPLRPFKLVVEPDWRNSGSTAKRYWTPVAAIWACRGFDLTERTRYCGEQRRSYWDISRRKVRTSTMLLS